MDGPALLARYLADAKLSQVAFAAESGVDQSHLSRYIKRHRTPGRANASAIESATSGAVPVESWDSPRSLFPRARRRRASNGGN